MLAEKLAFLSLAFMILYVRTKMGVVGLAAWLIFALACLAKVPDFLHGNDYYNTAVFISAGIFFTLLAVTAFRRNSNAIIEVTAFSALACAIYFPFAFVEDLNRAIILYTAHLTVVLGSFLGYPMVQEGNLIELNGKAVEIILACTAIESIALFAGATLGIKADARRKVAAFFVSVPVIYVLNLFRNVFVTVSFAYSWFGENSFYVAHHVVAKILSTLALIAIAYTVFRILPELADLIYSLKDEILRGVGVDREKRL